MLGLGIDKKPPSNPPWEFVFIPENVGKNVSIYDCFYCGLQDGKVECGGIYYCPNGLCGGPGSAWFNSTLKSYKDLSREGTHGRYTVDSQERVQAWQKRCEDQKAALEKKKEPELDFWIEERAGVQVLVYKTQGCRPATDCEIAMWRKLNEQNKKGH